MNRISKLVCLVLPLLMQLGCSPAAVDVESTPVPEPTPTTTEVISRENKFWSFWSWVECFPSHWWARFAGLWGLSICLGFGCQWFYRYSDIGVLSPGLSNWDCCLWKFQSWSDLQGWSVGSWKWWILYCPAEKSCSNWQTVPLWTWNTCREHQF